VRKSNGLAGWMGILAVTLAAGLAAACTSSSTGDPPASRFAVGTCRQAAPAVISVGHLIHSVQHDHKSPKSIQTAVTTEQTRLRALLPSAEPLVRPGLQQLISSIGYFRLSLDAHTYTPARLSDLSRAHDAFVRSCTTS
jgi:hypothetical protein